MTTPDPVREAFEKRARERWPDERLYHSVNGYGDLLSYRMSHINAAWIAWKEGWQAALDARQWPHISADEHGCATMEWWVDDRKITLYLVGHPHESMLKVWGPNVHDDMAYVTLMDAHQVREAFDWLRGAAISKPSGES